MTTDTTEVIFCTDSGRADSNRFIYPITTDRSVVIYISSKFSKFATYGIAYRRIGTNS